MKKNRFVIGFIIVLWSATILAAALHFSTRTTAKDGFVRIEAGNQGVELSYGELQLHTVSGEMRTNKGEVRQIHAQGIMLRDVIGAAGYDMDNYKSVIVTSDDGYYADLAVEEVFKENNATLILQDNQSMRLIVFEDSDSKRNVSNVVCISLK